MINSTIRGSSLKKSKLKKLQQLSYSKFKKIYKEHLWVFSLKQIAKKKLKTNSMFKILKKYHNEHSWVFLLFKKNLQNKQWKQFSYLKFTKMCVQLISKGNTDYVCHRTRRAIYASYKPRSSDLFQMTLQQDVYKKR